MKEFKDFINDLDSKLKLNPKKLIEEKKWDVECLDFNDEFAAIANIDNKVVILNRKNKNKINEDYILIHEYFHILEGKFAALKIDILNATEITELEFADVYAFAYFVRKNEIEKIPTNIQKILNPLIEQFR